ncbi:PIR protein [Plasmodium vivax]|uniref:VIR protein n=1 Tax=Plasmodium vivax TaxID=5855 RepID=A0A565A4W6_PLAVI|nr:PIR protein [Plasmodium vivax]
MNSLSCTDDTVEDGYTFYEHISEYLPYETFCINDEQCDQYKTVCKSIGSKIYGMEEKRAKICSRFHYLIEKLLKLEPSQSDIDEKFHLEYLNYWLNYELYRVNDNIEPKAFHQNMKSNNPRNTLLSKLNQKLSNIDEDEVKNMHELFYLYKNYINIKNSITGDNPSEAQFQHYTKHCVKKYQELEGICLKVRTSFCKALCDFRKKYESINLTDDIKNDWSYNSLPPLSKNEQIVEKVTQSPSHGDSSTLLQGSCRESEGGNVLTPCNKSDTGNESLIITDVTPALLPVDSVELSETSKIVSTHPVQRGSESIGATTVTSDINSQKYVENTEQIEIKNEDGFDIHKNKIIGTSVSTLGVSSLFFLFYKFTSLGSRFRSKNKSKKYMGNNFDEQSNNFLDTSEYQYLPEESMSYNISYNSV